MYGKKIEDKKVRCRASRRKVIPDSALKDLHHRATGEAVRPLLVTHSNIIFVKWL